MTHHDGLQDIVEDWGSEVRGSPPGGERNAVWARGGVVRKFDGLRDSLDVRSGTVLDFPIVTS